MGSVSAKRVRRSPGPASAVSAASVLPTTVHASGATTASVKRALRSGCSKQAYIRRASAASNWV